jgi:hypothetical protein
MVNGHGPFSPVSGSLSTNVCPGLCVTETDFCSSSFWGRVVARLFYPTQIVTMAIGIIYCIYFFKLLTSLTSVGCKHSQSWHMLLQKSCSKLSMARFNETALDNSELLTPKLSNSLRQNCGLLQSWKERDRNWHFHFRYSWQLLSQMGVPFSYIKSAISWPDGVSLFHQDWG